MKNEEILRAMNAINDKYILEAETYRHVYKVKLKNKFLEMAICICLVLVVTVPVLNVDDDKYENDTASYTSQSMAEDVSDVKTFSNSGTSEAYDVDTSTVMGTGINENEDVEDRDFGANVSFAGSAENDMYSSDAEAAGSAYKESDIDSVFMKSNADSQLVEVYEDIFITKNLERVLDSSENKDIVMATEIIFVDKETGNCLDIESSYSEIDRLFAEGYDIYIDANDGYEKVMINITESQLEDFSKNEKYEYWFGY